MHEYPHEYTQIWHVYNKLNIQIEENIIIAKIPKEYTQRLYPKNLKWNTRNYPKSTLKNVDEIIITFRKLYPKYAR